MNSFKDPDMAGIMNELSTFQKFLQTKPRKPLVEIPQDRTALMVKMLESLPSGYTCGLTQSIYLLHWESLNRVMHIQSFNKECDQVFNFLRSAKSAGDYPLLPSILQPVVPQILGTLALSARLDNLIATRISEDQISTWTKMIQTWLDLLQGKERLNIQTLRTQTLLLLVKMNNLNPTSDLWKESGTLVRSGMIIGLHQDPQHYDEFSLLEREQRRKLWRTIVELDVQISLAAGMPAAIRSSDFNSNELRNVDDHDLTSDMMSYPTNKPEHLWTDALPQITLSATIKERLDVVNIIAGRINCNGDAAGLLLLAKNLEESLHSLPMPFRLENAWGKKNDKTPGKLFTKVMLDVQLRRPILCIYLYLKLNLNRDSEVRKGTLRNAIAILGHLDALDPEMADPNTIKSRDQLDLFHVLCKDVIIQAALALCLEIRSFSSGTREEEGKRHELPDTSDEPLPWTKTSLTRVVENTLSSLLQRLGRFGTDIKDILPLAIVLQSARSYGAPEDKRVLMKKGAERILKACREAMPNVPRPPTASQRGHAKRPDQSSAIPENGFGESNVGCSRFF